MIDIIRGLQEYNAQVEVYDPWADPQEAQDLLGFTLTDSLQPGRYDGIVIAVAHSEFSEMETDAITGLGKQNSVIYDVKGLLPDACRSIRL